MSQFVATPTRSFLTAGAIGRNLRVKLDANGKIELAGLTDVEIGTLEEEAFAADEDRSVRLRSAQGTQMMTASAAVAVGDAAFTAANGQVGPSAAGAFRVGTFLSAATAAGDFVEVLRISGGEVAAT